MRFLAMIAGIGVLAGLIYKWRYKMLNALLAIGLIRQLAVSFTMKLPQFRKQMAPALFRRSSSSSAD